MLTSFILPLAFFSIVMAGLWWFSRTQRPAIVRAAAATPAARSTDAARN